jgi:hypothetical protein
MGGLDAVDSWRRAMSIHDFCGLLRATRCRSEDELDHVLYDACVLDPTVLEVSEGGVVIRILDSGLELAYPFSTDDFWQAIHAFDDQVQQRLEQRAEQEEPR